MMPPVGAYAKPLLRNPEYVITFVGDCNTGLRDSGFAYAPTGGIMLKQVNKDGTVGDVCAGE